MLTTGIMLAAFVLFTYEAKAAIPVTPIISGGTGTSTLPGYGQVLIGGKSGEYELVATSTFGGGGSGAVSSVFGRTGAVTAQSGDYITSQVTEGSNLYFTSARALSTFITDLAATTSVASITTLPNLSLPYSQLTGKPTALSAFTNDVGYMLSSAFNGLFDARLSATTSLPNITTLAALSLPLTQTTGTLAVNRGGTGATSLTGLITTADLASGNISQFTNDAGYVTSSFSTTSANYWGGTKGYLTSLAGAASSTLLGDTNTFSGNDTFNNLITASVSGNAVTVTNGVYTNTFAGLFDNRLSATTSLPNITTLSHLSLPYSQLTGTPAIASSTLLGDANTFSGIDKFTNASSDFGGTWQTFAPSHFQSAGNYLTALTGDVTASGPGSAAATLATVNSNVGSFTNANITVNAKGLITAASNGSAGGSTFSFTPTTNFNALTNATNTPIWLQAGLQASSTSHFANASFVNATTTILGIGSNYQQFWNSGADYLDTQNNGTTNPYTETRNLSNLANTTNGAESTNSMVVDCSGQNLFNNQNFFDTSIDDYPTSYNAILADVGAGTCPAIPLEIQVREPGANVNASNVAVFMPNTGAYFNGAATTTDTLSAKFEIASSTAAEILEVEGTPGTTNALGTSYLTVTGSANAAGAGKVGIGTSSPASTLSVVGNTYLAGTLLATSTVTFTGLTAGTGNGAVCVTSAGLIEYSSGANCVAGGGSSQWTTLGNSIWYPNGSVGVGTSTPFALLSIAATSTTGINSPTTLFAIASSTGGLSTTTLLSMSNTGDITSMGKYVKFGSGISADTTYCTYGNNCLTEVGSDNTTNGVNIEAQNNNAGVNAYSSFSLLNNLVDGTGTHFADIALSSSNYNNATFGTGLNTPNQLSLQDTDGPITIDAGTTTGAGYINFLLGGMNSGNELMRLTSSSTVGIGTTSPYAALSVVGASGIVADHYTATSTTNTSFYAGGLTVGDLSRAPYELSVIGTNNTTGVGDDGIMGFSNLGTTANNTLGFQFGQANTSGTVQTTAGFDLVGVSHTVGAQSASLAFATRNAGSFAERLRINFNGNIGIATTTPVANLQVTTATANATTTMEVGKANQNKGSCLKLYRTDGTAIYAYVAAGATTFTLSTTACATITGF